uniref:Thioredoxin-like 4ic n=1 Tax=Rhizophora mucronata TaxID=61149 RepID=A0A2P2KLN1_RHIMU
MPTVPLLENTQESCRVLLDSYLCLQKTLPDTLKFDLCPNQIAWERMPFLKNITGFLMAMAAVILSLSLVANASIRTPSL